MNLLQRRLNSLRDSTGERTPPCLDLLDSSILQVSHLVVDWERTKNLMGSQRVPDLCG